MTKKELARKIIEEAKAQGLDDISLEVFAGAVEEVMKHEGYKDLAETNKHMDCEFAQDLLKEIEEELEEEE